MERNTTNTTNNPFIPAKVRELAHDIQQNLDTAPTITRPNPRLFRLTIQNERVFCTVDYKFTGNRWEWADSKLRVDGKARPIMDSPASFYRLFRDPDSDGLRRVTNIPTLPPSTQILDPGIETALLKRLQVIDESAQVRMLTADKLQIMEFITTRSVVRWALTKDGLQLWLFVMDGLDYTPRFNNADNHNHKSAQTIMQEVLAFLGISHGVEIDPLPQKNMYPTHHDTTTPSISNAVRVRRQSVIRN